MGQGGREQAEEQDGLIYLSVLHHMASLADALLPSCPRLAAPTRGSWCTQRHCGRAPSRMFVRRPPASPGANLVASATSRCGNVAVRLCMVGPATCPGHQTPTPRRPSIVGAPRSSGRLAIVWNRATTAQIGTQVPRTLLRWSGDSVGKSRPWTEPLGAVIKRRSSGRPCANRLHSLCFVFGITVVATTHGHLAVPPSGLCAHHAAWSSRFLLLPCLIRMIAARCPTWPSLRAVASLRKQNAFADSQWMYAEPR